MKRLLKALCCLGLTVYAVDVHAALVQLSNPGFDSPPGVTEIGDVTDPLLKS